MRNYEEESSDVTEKSRGRWIIWTIPLCRRISGPDEEPRYEELLTDEELRAFWANLNRFLSNMAENWAIGEEYGDDMNVTEWKNEDGTINAYHHAHVILVKKSNSPLARSTLLQMRYPLSTPQELQIMSNPMMQGAIEPKCSADVRIMVLAKGESPEAFRYAIKDTREGLYRYFSKGEVSDPAVTAYLAKWVPLEWQKQVLDWEPSDRIINVIYDEFGGNGKSELGKWLDISREGYYVGSFENSKDVAQQLLANSAEDYELKGCTGTRPVRKYCLVDIPRAGNVNDPVFWEALENACKGHFEDRRNKYRQQWGLEHPMVMIVACNKLPWDEVTYTTDEGKERVKPIASLDDLLSRDRLRVWTLDDRKLTGPYRIDKESTTWKEGEYTPLTAYWRDQWGEYKTHIYGNFRMDTREKQGLDKYESD